MNWYGFSDKEIAGILCERIKRKRLNHNITQKDLAAKAGLHKNTISKYERGNDITIVTLIQILRALDELDFIDKFIPDQEVSPIELLKLKGKERNRASGNINFKSMESEW